MSPTSSTSSGYAGASADGSRVYFTTQTPLDATDTDTMVDVYERAGGRTTFVSPGGNGTHAVLCAGASADGSRVFLETNDVLGGGDLDTHQDVYERTSTGTKLLSVGVAAKSAGSAHFTGTSVAVRSLPAATRPR